MNVVDKVVLKTYNMSASYFLTVSFFTKFILNILITAVIILTGDIVAEYYEKVLEDLYI